MARHGKPEIFNTDQGSQFTGAAFTSGPQVHQCTEPAATDIATTEPPVGLAHPSEPW